jgi:hypothetical protein
MKTKAKRRSGAGSLDIATRRKKQKELMARVLERRVRERAQQLYDERGQAEGQALEDWVQAESEIVENSMAAPFYRQLKNQDAEEAAEALA